MSPVLRSNSYELDFDALYDRMWQIALDDQEDGTRLYRPSPGSTLKWLIAEMAGTPAEHGRTTADNNAIRQQVHRILDQGGWAERLTDTSFRLLKPPTQSMGYAELHTFMSAIPRGRWTTYRELGLLIGAHPRGLGSHIKACPVCPNAVRVLQVDGQPHGEGFRWSDPTRTEDPNDVLSREGVRFDGGPAARDQFLSASELRHLVASGVYAWPTVEWVKIPVHRSNGTPNGSPIRMRHFLDCMHWYRDDKGDLLGDPPMVATNEQMRDLPPCHDCAKQAASAANPESGPRIADEWPKGLNDPVGVLSDVTDGFAVTAIRREQSHLRRHLLAGRSVAPCALCGRLLPETVLVAAHIAPRRVLSNAERLDFASAAMLTCALGCDALFELGYIVVNAVGQIAVQRVPESEALRVATGALVGRRLAVYGAPTAPRFAQHRDAHCI